ncbi:unnamed protein product [marine sediment metagenome]|uniref:Uncharacterized protein n=1 Tax=marine sediment metagenome TaxID=412755 RepID=X1KW16_9ZZZZ
MWKNDRYIYSKGILQRIAWCYVSVYDGIPALNYEITNLYSIAEFKADFDLSLNAIGRGNWLGVLRTEDGKGVEIEWLEFKDFRGFGRLQKLVIADILGVSDNELEVGGFRDVARLRGYAYYLMKHFLDTGERKFVRRKEGKV